MPTHAIARTTEHLFIVMIIVDFVDAGALNARLFWQLCRSKSVTFPHKCLMVASVIARVYELRDERYMFWFLIRTGPVVLI